MNILLISSALNYRTLAGLSAKHKVNYLIPEQDMKQMAVEFKELDRLSGIHRKNLSLHPLKKVFAINAFKKALALIRQGDVDLLLTTSPLLGLVCLLFKIFYKKPYAIFAGQSFTGIIMAERPLYQKALLPFYAILMRISFHGADVIITHSRFMQAYVKHYWGRNVAGVYFYGVDTEAFKPVKANRKGRKFTIMYAGRFSLEKGVEQLLEALKILKRKGFDFRVLMCGQGPLKDTVIKVVEDGKIDLELHGYVDQKTLAVKINQADVFVVPSLSEGFGFIAAEALSCGVPVVASNVGGLPDSVEGYGILVAPKDPRALADAIQEVRDHYREYRIKALQGRKHVLEKFERKKVLKEFNDALEGALHK